MSEKHKHETKLNHVTSAVLSSCDQCQAMHFVYSLEALLAMPRTDPNRRIVPIAVHPETHLLEVAPFLRYEQEPGQFPVVPYSELASVSWALFRCSHLMPRNARVSESVHFFKQMLAPAAIADAWAALFRLGFPVAQFCNRFHLVYHLQLFVAQHPLEPAFEWNPSKSRVFCHAYILDEMPPPELRFLLYAKVSTFRHPRNYSLASLAILETLANPRLNMHEC